MSTLRTTLDLRKYDDGDETEIVWARPSRPDGIPDHELPY
jgi:hypothetical protein